MIAVPDLNKIYFITLCKRKQSRPSLYSEMISSLYNSRNTIFQIADAIQIYRFGDWKTEIQCNYKSKNEFHDLQFYVTIEVINFAGIINNINCSSSELLNTCERERAYASTGSFKDYNQGNCQNYYKPYP